MAPSLPHGGRMSPLDNLVCDLSNYDWDTFDAKAFYAAGVRQAIVGSQEPSVCGPMVNGLRSEGIEVIASYDLPYFGSDGSTQPQAERLAKFCEDYKIPFAWADAEIDANQTNVTEWKGIPTPSVSQRQSEFRWFTDLLAKNVPGHGVYTNGSWWTPNMGGSVEWCDSPLWLATYGVGGSAISPVTTANFGGWTAPVMHQYTSTHQINGRDRDMSYLFSPFNGTEDQLAQADIDRITALENGMKSLLGNVVDLQFALFSGNEERDHTLPQRTADVAYRIDQRLGRATDGTVMNSVSDNAWAAIKAVQALASAAGVSEGKVREILGDELSVMLTAAQATLSPTKP